MFRKEFWILSILAAATLVIVIAVGALAGYILERDAEAIAKDSIPGLTNAGEATVITEENWYQIQLLAYARSPAERVALAHSVMTNSSDFYWQAYKKSIWSPEDAENYAMMINARSNYFRLREEFFNLVQAGGSEEARRFLEQKLTPGFEIYRRRSATLFDYNVRMSRERADRVMRIARFVPWTLGALGIVLFAFGAVLGLRAAFTGLTFASGMRRRT